MRDRTRQGLEDMLENARTALRYCDEDRWGWQEDELRVDAILRRVTVVGEAASRVPIADRDQFPGIEWQKIIRMRQHLVHGYDKIDLDILDGVLRREPRPPARGAAVVAFSHRPPIPSAPGLRLAEATGLRRRNCRLPGVPRADPGGSEGVSDASAANPDDRTRVRRVATLARWPSLAL